MSKNLYAPERLLSRAKEWRAEAAVATIPEMRAFCLDEAGRCELAVRRSWETPAVGGEGAAVGQAFHLAHKRRLVASEAPPPPR
jgi:hypothetical protein